MDDPMKFWHPAVYIICVDIYIYIITYRYIINDLYLFAFLIHFDPFDPLAPKESQTCQSSVLPSNSFRITKVKGDDLKTNLNDRHPEASWHRYTVHTEKDGKGWKRTNFWWIITFSRWNLEGVNFRMFHHSTSRVTFNLIPTVANNLATCNL